MPLSRRLFVAAACAPLIGPAPASAARDMVVGSGVAATQHRNPAGFSSIALGAPFWLVLRQGTREGIEIVADDNLLPLIETRITGRDERTLTIQLPRETRVEPHTPVVVTVDFVKLESLALGSSGTITGQGLHLVKLAAAVGGSGDMRLSALEVATTFEVSVGGSGRITADGRARSLSARVAGSGRCDLDHLVAGDVSVALAGSGTARVYAQTSLNVTIVGSGDVLYRGEVTPSATLVGNGRLKRL
ncbi:MAG: head GIN domain-containing protein [Caldimonas sp.]